MADCLINPLKNVVKCIFTDALWPIVKRHIDYWWCFDGNVQGLRDEIGRLERERGNMDQKIVMARLRAPAASMVPITHAPTLEFQSRKRIEEDIMESLEDGNVRMISIWGAGGVGKTTMAKRIEDKAIKEKLFDEVVTVVVSQHIDMFKIQEQIAEMLDLSLNGDTLGGRAHELRTRLMDSKKKLIIFDDVWKSFDLKHAGVPDGGCKIILTSRLKDVCEEMEADKVIEIQFLEEEEAWMLFREKSGDCVDDSYLYPLAKDIAAECKGLPIALVTVGKALQNKSLQTWKDALSQLRTANPTNFPQVLEKVYKPLKLSDDFLENESEKSLFLLCCLFPEDYNIKIDDLAFFSFGLGVFDRIDNIEDGRNRTYHLLERLRSRFLLMTGGDEHEVKMHGGVRDGAIFIGSKEMQGFLKSLEVCSMGLSSKDSSSNCYWMSVDISLANAKLPIGLDFPNLRLLMILKSSYYKFPGGFDVNDICFEGMKELKVLYFSNQNFWSLPSSLKFLKKLRNLHLKYCKVKDISVVSELASLEILHIWSCNEIEELPADFGGLKFLRLLELSRCKKLERIVGGVISSLVRLEELKIVGCFNKWEAKGNASLSELESLPNLTSLEIEIFDPNLVAQEILLSKHLRRYQICFCSYYGGQFLISERKIELYLPRDATVGNWIRQLAKNTQSLVLGGDGSNYFNLGEIESLRELVFQNCSTVEKLVNAVDCKFPMLEHLELIELRELEVIIDGAIPEGSNSFQIPNQNVYLVNLKFIYICKCPNLRYLFSMATARTLVQLESLELYECEKMEQLLWNEMESSNTEEEASIIIEFPKLKKLKLCDLPNLLVFTQLGVEIIKFPRIIELEIYDCPKLRIKTDNYPTCMIMIEKLLVWDCDTIEEIFRDDGNRHIIFQELRELRLMELPCLTTLYRGVESIQFPKLKELAIGSLPRLNSFVEIEDSEADTHDHHSLHFFCNKKVEMTGLKELCLVDLSDKINNIWCRHIPISLFHNLERLHIDNVDGIRNLISSSIAKVLVNLKNLVIRYCEWMADVIEDETEVPVNSVFPELAYLEITGNCKLTSFCQWKHSFELPSLEEVEISGCPLMKTFTLGLLSTPKLHRFNINDKDIEMKDLNGGIHHFTSAEITNKDENNDEYNEDEKIEAEERTESSNNNLM